VFARAKRGNLTLCEFCGNVITQGTGHMHEKLFKGNGGEVSLDNCVAICAACHIGKDGEHGNRKWGGKDASNS
jgi:5-methylcytosine-specific restriction endonuclease McrA